MESKSGFIAPVIKSAEFTKSAVFPDQYPESDLPEIAFAGRSNVGKSSLINCLLLRRNLVRTSRTPGRTRTINFFTVNRELVFVDLPGYGYAKVPKETRIKWGPMVEGYLKSRQQLRAVVHIMDLRHPPTADDLNLWNWLRHIGIPSLPVMTKADKVKRTMRIRQLEDAARLLGVSATDLIAFSAVTREGRELLWSRILSLLGKPQ